MPKKMNCGIITAPGKISLMMVNVPVCHDQQIMLKVEMCGLCGSDIAAFRNSGHKKFPYSPGHEFFGTVVETGASITEFVNGDKVIVNPNLGCGDCIYCLNGKINLCDNLKNRDIKSNGGFSEYVAIDYRMAVKFPDKLTNRNAVFVEPLSCAVHLVNQLHYSGSGLVLIFGAGIMGLLTGLVCKSRDITTIFVETDLKRKQDVMDLFHCKAYTPEELSKKISPEYFMFAVDCSGNSKAIGLAVKYLKKAGTLVLGGITLSCGQNDICLQEITIKELTLRGAWLNPWTFTDALDITIKQSDILNMLRVEFRNIEEIEEIFERGINTNVHKTVIKFPN